MKFQFLAACAALVTLSAGSAIAAESVTAKLATPIAEKVKFIAGGAMFSCEGDTCVAAAPTSQTFATATCKTLAGKVGVVVSFKGHKALDEARLASCNAKAVASTADATRLARQ